MQPTQDSASLAEGHQVITATALVHHNFDGSIKVFLAKRAETKRFLPGIFELPGGHIDFGEDVVDGLVREFREEFNADILVGDPFAAFTYKNHVKKSHSIEVIYFATLTSPLSAIRLNPEDHSEFRWISLENINEIYINNAKGADDDEFVALRRGLEILNGSQLNFG